VRHSSVRARALTLLPQTGYGEDVKRRTPSR
jgi:hypothetical protein